MLSYPKIKSIKVFVKDKKTEKIITENIINAENYQVEALSLINQAQELFLQSLNIDNSKISRNMFYAISSKNLEISDMITPAFFNPLYTSTIIEIEKNNKCELLGDLADFKNGDEVGSVNYKGYLERKATYLLLELLIW